MCDAILEFEEARASFPGSKQKRTFQMFAKNGDIFWEQFSKLIASTPLLLWPIQRLQAKLMKNCLGEPFWRSQKQAMIHARERLGIRRDLS